MTAPPPPGRRVEWLNRAIAARPVAVAAVLVTGLALLLGLVAAVLDDAEPATNAATWVVVGLFVFDCVVVWLLPDMVGAGPESVALPVLVFAAAPALTAYSTVFLDQPRWLFAAGFTVSVALAVASTHRLKAAARRSG